jgi:hypothetical protein
MNKIQQVTIREFPIEDIPLSCTWIIISSPGGGKTTLEQNLMYHHKHRYPIAKIMTGSNTAYEEFCGITHPLYVSNGYDEKEHAKFMFRQRVQQDENGNHNPDSAAILILDDVGEDTKIFKNKYMKGTFKIGSRHWTNLVVVSMHYAVEMPPDVRNNASYIAIFRENNEASRKKLYENYGGICGTYKNFCDLLDQLTGDHCCMIISKRTESTNLEDCIFWYRTQITPRFKFGCREYREWAETRYDKDYVNKPDFDFSILNQ